MTEDHTQESEEDSRTRQLREYDENRENHDYGHNYKVVGDLREEVKDISEDVTPEEMALLGELMNHQTSHEVDTPSSMAQIFEVTKSEFSEDYELDKVLRVKAVSERGSLEVRTPPQNGQFGKWEMKKARIHSSKYGGSLNVELLYKGDVKIELTRYTSRLFLQYNGEEVGE